MTLDDLDVTVQRLELHPGETVVITFPDAITEQQARCLQEHWSERFPDNPCVVLADGAYVSGVLVESHIDGDFRGPVARGGESGWAHRGSRGQFRRRRT
jgi:hypothetical protein